MHYVALASLKHIVGREIVPYIIHVAIGTSLTVVTAYYPRSVVVDRLDVRHLYIKWERYELPPVSSENQVNHYVFGTHLPSDYQRSRVVRSITIVATVRPVLIKKHLGII